MPASGMSEDRVRGRNPRSSDEESLAPISMPKPEGRFVMWDVSDQSLANTMA